MFLNHKIALIENHSFSEEELELLKPVIGKPFDAKQLLDTGILTVMVCQDEERIYINKA